MASGLQANLPLPAFDPTPFIIPLPQLDAIEFAGFGVNHTEIKPAHADFIRTLYVNALIKAIDGLKDPRMNLITLHIRGLASATGPSTQNLELSAGRAKAIGIAIQQAFDAQKGSSSFARVVKIAIDAKGLGDVAARRILDAAKRAHPGGHLSNAQIDQVSGGFRGAIVSLNVVERLPDGDHPIYQCRQIFVFNLKKEKVPVNQLVDELEALKKAHPEITLISGLLIDELIEGLKEMLKAVAKDLPFLTLITESLEFIVPSDVAQCFDFRDPRGDQATYNFFGSENKKSLSLLGAIAKILKIAKFLDKAESVLRRIEGMQTIVGKLSAVKKVLDSLLKNASGPDSPMRRILGPTNTEFLIKLLRDEGDPGQFIVVPTSNAFPFQFKKAGFFKVQSFRSFAQTVGRDLFFSSDLTLSFGATDLTGISGFEAEVTISTNFSVRNSLASFGIAHGQLISRPEIHP